MQYTANSALSGKAGIICNEIEKRLSRGQYRFGQEILANDLVNEFGASRAPVMAALNYLRAEGYLVITPQVGCKVVSPSLSDIEDYFFIFGKVEGALAALAAERHTDVEIARLQATHQQIKQLTPKKGELISEAFTELVADFHRQIHEMSHSKTISERASKYWKMSEFFLFNGNSMQVPGGETLKAGVRQRGAIVDAIVNGDAELACKLMEEHMQGKPKRALAKGFQTE